MIRRIECVCMPTNNVAESEAFYLTLGLRRAWGIVRPLEGGGVWNLVGLKFPQAHTTELVLSDNPDVDFTEIELHCDDVRETFEAIRANPAVTWIREPFATESGHVAVMEAPDKNVFVLVGA